jgi:uncharacterized membrane protein
MSITVKPKEGLTVAGFPSERQTERTPQVIRLLKDGDLIEIKPAKVAKKAPAKKQEAK